MLSSVTNMSSATTASEDFRSVVLRGRNVASFKFALAKSVLTPGHIVVAGSLSHNEG